MGNYIHIKFNALSKEQQEILIAQLSNDGFEGFEEGVHHLSAFIPQEQFNEQALQELVAAGGLSFSKEVIQPRNWNEEWEKNFDPVIVNDFCAIRAHFHAPVTNVQHEVIITPKMSFGTGHHATTFLMIAYMQTVSFEGKKVMDFGTGTGVLAILAEQLGASYIKAIDNDDWSIENAVENTAVNRCRHIVLQKADVLETGEQFDVLLANINKHVLLANMENMKQHLSKNSVLFMSGLLVGDLPDIRTATEATGLQIIEHQEKNGWIAVKIKVH